MHRNLGVKRVADAGVLEPLAPIHALSLGRVLGRDNFRKASRFVGHGQNDGACPNNR
jgi:hypothetical protein